MSHEMYRKAQLARTEGSAPLDGGVTGMEKGAEWVVKTQEIIASVKKGEITLSPSP